VHAGGLGDQVLFGSALEALHAARPKMRIWVAVQAALTEAAATMSPWLDGIVPIVFDPYRLAMANHIVPHAKEFLEALPSAAFDVVVSAECRPTWLSWLVAGHLRPQRLMTLHRSAVSLTLLRILREKLGLVFPKLTRYASTSQPVHEIARYGLLLEAFGVSADPVPRWQVPEAERAGAASLMGLEAGRFIACFPGGAASVPYKRWPADRFATVLKCAHAEFGLEGLIVGTQDDLEPVEEIARACRDIGLESAVWYDPGDDFSQTRAVLAAAGAFVGNDSGPAHVSQACGVPGVAVFGGGTYPSYLPWGPSAVASVNPLPCFGCDWDCAFDRGLCVEAVSATDVLAALRQALAPGARSAAVSAVSNMPVESCEIVAAASAMYRRAQRDRAARLETIQRERYTKHLLKLDRKERQRRAATALEELRRQADLRRAELAVASEEIEMLRGHAEERLVKLTAAVAEGDRVRGQAEERLAIILATAPQIENLQLELANAQAQTSQLSALLAERDQVLAAAEERLASHEGWIAEREARIALLQRAADERVVVIESSAAAQRELAAMVAERDGALAAGEERLASHEEWIAEREARIALLQRVADERVEVIESSAAAQRELVESVQALQAELETRNVASGEQMEYAIALGVETAHGRVSELERVAHERLVAIQKLDNELNSVRAEAVRRAEILAEMTDMLDRQGREIERLRSRGA
jgi:ADP-heptose:LPS heptosyltransferase